MKAFDEAKEQLRISSQYTSLPIYKLGEMVLESRFDSPMLLLTTFQFFSAFLQETRGISLGHKYYDKHPHIDVLTKFS